MTAPRTISQRTGSAARLLAILPVVLLLSACSDSIPNDLQLSNYAGAGRAWHWPNASIPPFSYFNEIEIASLEAGLLGPPLSLGTHDMVALGAGGTLLKIRNDRLLWSVPIREGESFMPQLAADAGGRIYVQSVDAELFAVDTGGRPLWSSPSVRVEEGKYGLPLYPLALEDRVIIGNTDGLIAAVDTEGKELWTIAFETKLTRSLASAGDEGIVVGQTHRSGEQIDTVSLVTRDGRRVWNRAVGGRIDVGPVVADGVVVVGLSSRTGEGKYRPELLALEISTGEQKWRAPLRVVPGNVAVDAEGNVYVSGGGGGRISGGVVASFGPSGEKRWEIGLRQSVPSTILVAGNLFFVARQGRAIGLFCYTREGSYLKYAPIETPEPLALPPTILPTGKILLATRTTPLLLRN